jgi:hypothetical protein
MTNEVQPEQISGLTKSVELLIRQNNKLNARNLELQRQQESMQIDINKIQQALAGTLNETNYKPAPLYKSKIDISNLFTPQKLQPAHEAQA